MKYLLVICAIIFCTSFSKDFPFYLASATARESDGDVTVYPRVIKAKSLKEAKKIYTEWFMLQVKLAKETFDPKHNALDVWKIESEDILKTNKP